jgi:omega-6 fatty acid desaturase (delta-12 desaturase)
MGRELLDATRPFANETNSKSRWYVVSTFGLTVATLAAAGFIHWWPIRTALSILGTLLLVRCFITFHDFMHGSLLRGSKAASIWFHIYAAFALTPTRSWAKSHNYHHGHVGQISGAGAFPIITTTMWRTSSFRERFRYRASRHPLIVLFGYVTIFALTICLLPLLRDPKRHWDWTRTSNVWFPIEKHAPESHRMRTERRRARAIDAKWGLRFLDSGTPLSEFHPRRV